VSVTLYPTLHEAVALHEALIKRFGGTLGVRDMGALESALHRPRSGYYGRLSEQAGALMHSLAMNHAFVDGNKRVAFALTAVFLRMNGYRLAVSADAAEAFLIEQVIVSRKDVEVIAPWLERHMRPA
jgi:death-on-curing protein